MKRAHPIRERLTPSRVAGLIVIVIILFSSCTGKGCKSCEGCRESGTQIDSAVPGTATGSAGKPGPGKKPVEKKPGDAFTKSPSPYRPVLTLPSDTAEYAPDDEQMRVAEEFLEDLETDGEGDKPPLMPLGLVAEDLMGIYVSLAWNDMAENETDYQVDRSDGGGPFMVVFRLPADTSGIIDGPLAMGTYSYRVRALGAGGASPFAGPVSIMLEGPANPPAPPVALDAAADPPDKIILIWEDQADNEEYFRVERSEGGAFSSLAWLPADSNAYVDTRVSESVTYTYRVVAGNEAGESAPSNEASATIEPAEEPPQAPANLRVASQDRENLVLEWDDMSDNEDAFILEESPVEDRKFRTYLKTGRGETTVSIKAPSPGEQLIYRVLAENAQGVSPPSNEVTVTGEEEATAMYTLWVDPSGAIDVIQPEEGLFPRLVVMESTVEAGAIVAKIAVRNVDSGVQLENVYLLVESSDQSGIMLSGCDRGPGSCSVDEGIEAGHPVGYQYVEGGYRSQTIYGGEMVNYPNPKMQFAVRDIWPACGSVPVEWTIQGVRARTGLGVNMYADFMPADFRADPRFDNDLMLWLIEPYSIGVSAEPYVPGARDNPTSRPINRLRKGDVFAVNVSVEAADWMENQAGMGRVDVNLEYIYWRNLAWALTYDPSVIYPIKRPVVMGTGERLSPGVLDPMVVGRDMDDGWSAYKYCWSYMHRDQGWVAAIFDYPLFVFGQDDSGNDMCIHCGQEGFIGPDGIIDGPDPAPEASLGLVYFEVIGDSGQGTALRLSPRNNTAIMLYSTGPDVSNKMDEVQQDQWLEVNKRLPMTTLFPGDYQVQESYICVE